MPLVPKKLSIDFSEIPQDDTFVIFDQMLARSQPMKVVLHQVLLAAATDIPVLILGETGTGKELVARSIHKRSGRKSRPFVALNTGALPTELIASELFGHEKGAFTGAGESNFGRISLAEGGTLFLDEVEAMEPKAQVTLLRVLENHEYYRVGGRRPISCDVRIVAASNTDLFQKVQEGKFRQDLFFRLDVFTIQVPELRRRQGALPLFCREFIKEYNMVYGLEVEGIEAPALKIMELYPWPGNVRELKNVLQRAMLLARSGKINAAHLPERIAQTPGSAAISLFAPGRPLKDVEKEYIQETLRISNGNKSLAAKTLGISRKSLYQKLR